MNSGLTTLKRISFLALISGCLTICSCEPFEVTSPEDYVGPKPVPEANAVSALVVPPAIKEKPAATGPLQISITDALLLALQNNSSLLVQRYAPQIQRTFEQEDLAVFDPDLTASVSQNNVRSQTTPRPGLPSVSSDSRNFSADVTLQQYLPTGGTIALTGSTDILKGSFLQEPFISSRLGLSATQSLLRGFGPKVALAILNQARIDTKVSQYELRGFAEALAAQTEETYWNYALAEQKIKIYEDSLAIAQKQLEETQERIKIGVLAQSELPAAEAEVALRQEDLINAHSSLIQTKLNLLRLLNPASPDIWNKTTIIIKTPPVSPTVKLDEAEPHVQLAMRMRPDLNQAKLHLQRDELELVKTKNGLLPQLDLFVTLGNTGFANSFGNSVGKIGGRNYDVLAGVNLEFPPVNRAARARDSRATFTRDQAREAIKNMTQLVEVDVRSAYEEIIRSQEQVTATAATRRLQEEKLRVETEKFKVGKSTSLLVAQAQRDLLSSRINEVSAVVDYLNSFIELYRLEGSLLERRGIVSPGREPVKLAEMSEL